MTMVNRGLIDCAIIKVETSVRNDDYNKKDNTLNQGYNYTVRMENLDKTMLFIQETFNEYNLPCVRIYPTGFACVPESFIWTKQKIVEQVKNEVNRLNNEATVIARK